MKLIHCADVHLGSKMESKLPPDKAAERRSEVRSAFADMARYARENGVDVILLCGDVFDSDRPLKKDKEYFYSVVRQYPEIDFLYLRGNHDGEERYTVNDLKNLKTFGGDWSVYSYGNVDIYGMEMADDNARSLYAALHCDAEKINVVMLHGQTADSEGRDRINLTKLRNKNIDYLALGHVHSYVKGKLDDRGEYAYCGCLEGRGFDECGQKGFILLDVTDAINAQFIPRSVRNICEVRADISGAQDAFEACVAARASVGCDRRDLVRVVLTGEIGFDNENLARDVEKELAGDYYFVSVKDKTVRKFDVAALAADKSLKGEFIRTVLAASGYTEEDKSQIIAAGLKALAGREVD